MLIGSVQEYDSTFDLTRVETAGSHLWVPGNYGPLSTELRLRVRANDVSICLERPAKTSILNVMEVDVLGIQEEPAGSVLVHLRIGTDVLLARVTRRSCSELSLRAGVKVFAQVKSIAVRNRLN